MPPTKRGLGRGLGALIPPSEPVEAPEKAGGVLEVPIGAISPNPLQPRQIMDTEGLRELADSIREHGLIQPLIVTRITGPGGGTEYQLVTGERRWRAAQMAGQKTVPVIIKEATSREMLEWALVENLQRTDLNPLEEANAYRTLMIEFGLTQEQVAEEVGKSRTAVANALRLLRLPREIKAALLAGEISEGHARALLGLPTPEAQLAALATVQRRTLSVRQTEEMVRRTLTRVEQKQKVDVGAAEEAWKIEVQALEDRFRAALGTKVNLTRSKRGGKLVIRFYSEEELQRIYDLIVGQE
ncbi:MAG: ParB/RepB/Spo0J family partition protein [Anaerolineae bacterium]|nr:ParB/RepB/Spo0J family partition protein [Anaerolineae bacterium]